MLYLYNRSLALTRIVSEYTSSVTTERLREHGSFEARIPDTEFTEADAAYFCMMQGSDRVYLVEYVELATTGLESYCHIKGREATAMLEDRVVLYAKRWYSSKPGAIVKTLIDTLATAIPNVAFGTGDTLGTAVAFERSWGQVGEACLEVLATQDLGMRTRLDGTTIDIDVYAPTTNTALVGDKYENASTSSYTQDESSWYNVAAVAGEGEGSTRWLITVDQSGSDEYRALYIDARDLRRDLGISPAINVAASTNTFTTAEAHGLSDGNIVIFTGLSGGAPLANGTGYYVRDAGTLQFKVSETDGGGVLDITTDGTGSISLTQLSVSQYSAALTTRGKEKLKESPRISYATAKLDAAIPVGDVVTYNSDQWSATLMVTELVTTREGSAVRYDATLGEPPLSLRRAVRRMV